MNVLWSYLSFFPSVSTFALSVSFPLLHSGPFARCHLDLYSFQNMKSP